MFCVRLQMMCSLAVGSKQVWRRVATARLSKAVVLPELTTTPIVKFAPIVGPGPRSQAGNGDSTRGRADRVNNGFSKDTICVAANNPRPRQPFDLKRICRPAGELVQARARRLGTRSNSRQGNDAESQALSSKGGRHNAGW